MAVRLASDTIRTLYAIQCITKDVKHRSLSPTYKQKSQGINSFYVKTRQMSSNRSPTDSMRYDPSAAETSKRNQLQPKKDSASEENALVHKVHPEDRPLRNAVPERAKCKEIDDIFAKWNVRKPKK